MIGPVRVGAGGVQDGQTDVLPRRPALVAEPPSIAYALEQAGDRVVPGASAGSAGVKGVYDQVGGLQVLEGDMRLGGGSESHGGRSSTLLGHSCPGVRT